MNVNNTSQCQQLFGKIQENDILLDKKIQTKSRFNEICVTVATISLITSIALSIFVSISALVPGVIVSSICFTMCHNIQPLKNISNLTKTYLNQSKDINDLCNFNGENINLEQAKNFCESIVLNFNFKLNEDHTLNTKDIPFKSNMFRNIPSQFKFIVDIIIAWKKEEIQLTDNNNARIKKEKNLEEIQKEFVINVKKLQNNMLKILSILETQQKLELGILVT